MFYLLLDQNKIKLLLLKKSMLGQYDSVFFEKSYESDLLTNGRITNVDHVASAIKEALQSINQTKLTEKELILVLPQNSFHYLRCDVPADVAPGALASFVRDKAKASLHVNLDDCLSEYFSVDQDKQKQINYYAIETETIAKFREALELIDLKLAFIIPDTLAYYKLFEKTLRMDKKEYIWYVSYEKNNVMGYLYDTYGLIAGEKWSQTLDEGANIEKVLREKAQEYEGAGMKLNRLILSGGESEHVRQDTFTKSIGVWTNPLKRIISNFYQEYLKMLVGEANATPFPVLTHDVTLGAFIFTQENKNFSFLKPTSHFIKAPSIHLPKTSIRKKELLIFIGSFVASFIFFLLVSHTKLSLPTLPLAKTQVTPTVAPTIVPSITPTPTFKKEDLKLKVLNGSGTRGKATDVKDVLTKLGYGEILTGNADNFDFTKTEIQVKADKKAAASMLVSDLKDKIASPKVSTLTASEAADVVIIVGADFK